MRTFALRVFALSVAGVALAFLLNSHLIFGRGWPGAGTSVLGLLQAVSYAVAVAIPLFYVWRSRVSTIHDDAERLTAWAAFTARAAFWAVLLVGLADMAISFLRVEAFLPAFVGEDLAKSLGRPAFRGQYVHYPLIAISIVIAALTRTIGFTWLAFLIVLAELQIVFARFIFSYEQAFMGDLVRFWYAALFLFASAYTLLHEGHVRVDILYTGFSPRGKAWTNVIGALVLGLPLCWVILTRGLWDKSNVISAPLLSFEVSQSGYGMYTKYLMAGFLIVYALSMLFQFLSQLLSSAAVLLGEARPGEEGLVSEEQGEPA